MKDKSIIERLIDRRVSNKEENRDFDVEIDKKRGEHIKITPVGIPDSRDDLYNAEGFFWNDLTFETFGTEWLYLSDASTGEVYSLTDYSYNLIDDIMSGKTVEAPYMGDFDEYMESAKKSGNRSKSKSRFKSESVIEGLISEVVKESNKE